MSKDPGTSSYGIDLIITECFGFGTRWIGLHGSASILLVASLMSLMASLVTTSRMQQCFDVFIDIYHEFLLLFYCCVLLEIKLSTTTTTITTITTITITTTTTTTNDNNNDNLIKTNIHSRHPISHSRGRDTRCYVKF